MKTIKKKKLASQILKSKLKRLTISEDFHRKKDLNMEKILKLAEEVRKSFTDEELLLKGITPYS